MKLLRNLILTACVLFANPEMIDAEVTRQPEATQTAIRHDLTPPPRPTISSPSPYGPRLLLWGKPPELVFLYGLGGLSALAAIALLTDARRMHNVRTILREREQQRAGTSPP